MTIKAPRHIINTRIYIIHIITIINTIGVICINIINFWGIMTNIFKIINM